MSIATCPYCGKTYDQDFEVEHEEICKEEQAKRNYLDEFIDTLPFKISHVRGGYPLREDMRDRAELFKEKENIEN